MEELERRRRERDGTKETKKEAEQRGMSRDEDTAEEGLRRITQGRGAHYYPKGKRRGGGERTGIRNGRKGRRALKEALIYFNENLLPKPPPSTSHTVSTRAGLEYHRQR